MEASEIAKRIIKAQERVIGPLAVEQARKVSGLTLDWPNEKVSINLDSKIVLDNLVKNYEHLFGQASVEVCKDAVKNVIDEVPRDQLPPVLTA